MARMTIDASPEYTELYRHLEFLVGEEEKRVFGKMASLLSSQASRFKPLTNVGFSTWLTGYRDRVPRPRLRSCHGCACSPSPRRPRTWPRRPPMSPQMSPPAAARCILCAVAPSSPSIPSRTPRDLPTNRADLTTPLPPGHLSKGTPAVPTALHRAPQDDTLC
ncbi:uncharacterized protein LOC125943331 [Dermacentor silvarum]|uniref:uncharacterized protein LOC125943331 n=1 Tax=Dermacentor silvarum TaxID=543639 RepID=UPI002100D23F|nr:uncharacterized protein LOC125943331 [Dermacentor silvarum]